MLRTLQIVLFFLMVIVVPTCRHREQVSNESPHSLSSSNQEPLSLAVTSTYIDPLLLKNITRLALINSPALSLHLASGPTHSVASLVDDLLGSVFAGVEKERVKDFEAEIPGSLPEGASSKKIQSEESSPRETPITMRGETAEVTASSLPTHSLVHLDTKSLVQIRLDHPGIKILQKSSG